MYGTSNAQRRTSNVEQFDVGRWRLDVQRSALPPRLVTRASTCNAPARNRAPRWCLATESRCRHRVAQHAQPFDLHFAYVARLEIHRRLAGKADARRRTREDHIAGTEHADLRDIGHQFIDFEDELG